MGEPDSLEEQRKAIMPFLQRAQEIEQTDPKVAYYCRLYAVDQALKFEKRVKEINALLGSVMAKLEQDKPHLVLDKEKDQMHCEGFAIKIFNNADRVDRAGRADENTSKAFLAASYFLEILNQFGPIDNDLVSKQKYAWWRAYEIRKAVRQGRQPAPPPAQNQAPAQAPPGATFGMRDQSLAAASATASMPPTYDTFSEGPAAAAPPVSAAALLPSFQQYKPGSQVLYYGGVAGSLEAGTVGQVITNHPSGELRYKVALRERLVETADAYLAPNTSKGQKVLYLQPNGPPVTAFVQDINGAEWPLIYLIQLEDGSQVLAPAPHISMVLPEDGAPAAALPLQVQAAFVQQTYPSIASESMPTPLPGDGPASGLPPVYTHHSTPNPSTLPAAHYPGIASASDFLPSGSVQSPRAPAAPTHTAPQAPPRPSTPSQPPVSSHLGSNPGHYKAAAAPAAPALPAAPLQLPTATPGYKPSIQVITEAQKNAKYAVSSLNFEDTTAAIKYLTIALRLLTQPQ